MADLKKVGATALRNAGESAKAVAAFLVSAAAVLVASSDLLTDLTGKTWGVSGIVAAITGAAVWLTRNQERVDELGDEAAGWLDK